jgi:hypothetical protein
MLGRGLLLAAAVSLLLASGVSFAAAAADDVTPADALMRVWPGMRDSSEEVVVSPERGAALALDDHEPVRVRTLITRVSLPWLGARVLYLEEFLHDQPSVLRRQLLLRVETETVGARRVRVLPYVFRNGERWRRLHLNPRRLSQLRSSDLEPTAGCDLVLNQEGEQFRGGTTGLNCLADAQGTRVYVDYRLVIGSDVYWYRRRLMREDDDRLHEETIGYNWFAPNQMRLFACRVEYSVSGKPTQLRLIARPDLHDQGGHARFTAPDGRRFDLSLHTQDWPFASERDSLLLLLEQPDDPDPVASAWTDPDAKQIGIDLGWLRVRCGPLVPETAEVGS